MDISKVPGVGTYESKNQKETLLAKISPLPLKHDFEKLETPSPGTYTPRHEYTEKKGQYAILHLTSARTDFTQSPTKKIGPGTYEIVNKFEQELGLMCSRTERLQSKIN